MAKTEPPFTLGIEEEYLLVDAQSGDLAEAPAELMEACTKELEDQVSPEFLQCQIEIGTRVCTGINEAREDLKRLRSTVARVAASPARSRGAPLSCTPVRACPAISPMTASASIVALNWRGNACFGS
ncbi:MAG: glutamate-cysteine ligase family protein, partial [Nioella sp.]